MSVISLAIVLAAAAVLLALRRRLFALGSAIRWLGGFLPANAPAPHWLSRVTETMALAAAGVTILIIKSTRQGEGGLMLILDRLDPQFAKMNVALFVAAAVGTAAAILLALLWRTGPAALLLAVVLVGYGWILDESIHLWEWLTPPDAKHASVEYTIALSDEIAGADLWVNGVFLGQSPVKTTRSGFLERVPYWPKPPKGYRDGTEEVRLPRYGPTGTSTGIRQRWIAFYLPGCEARFGRRHTSTRKDLKEYYARVRLDGESGVGHHSGYSGRGGLYKRSYRTMLHVEFLSHRERMEKLLDVARLADYRVTPAWFQAMASYRKRGWMTLRKAAVREPDLVKVFEAWAAWRYQFDDATKPTAAWRAFLRVCARADEQRRYHAASVDGRATELLVPKLDPEQLVAHAVAFLKRYRGWPGFARGKAYGRVQFEVVAPQNGSKARVPPSAAVVAHAIWMLDERLDRKDDATPNIVERRVTPALIRWFPYPYRSEAACALGGPAIERFLTRQSRRCLGRPPGSSLMGDLSLNGGVRVNRWLYALANLRGPLGKQFRRDHEDLLLQLADRLLQRFHIRTGHAPGFLFLDLDRADSSLAMKYWPRYRTIASRRPDCLLAAQWDYLVRMDPLATVEMYLDAWRHSTHDNSTRQEALRKLRSLPDTRRQALLDAVTQEVRRTTRPPDDWRGPLSSWQDCVTRQLEKYASDEHIAEVALARLHEGLAERQRNYIALWIEHTRPDHPLVGRLAQQEDPQLRLLAVPALKAHPTRRNREVLRCLLSDPDVQVRATATRVDAELRALAARDPIDFGLGSGVGELPVDACQQAP